MAHTRVVCLVFVGCLLACLIFSFLLIPSPAAQFAVLVGSSFDIFKTIKLFIDLLRNVSDA